MSDAPPTTTPVDQQTPDTQARGHLVPRITAIMEELQLVCPPMYYPADGERQETPYPDGWLRGGTSPSGDGHGTVDPGQANWWIGERYAKTKNYGQPQRIVWIPPRRGRERFVKPDHVGRNAEVLGSPQIGGGGDPPGFQFRALGTRVCPCEVDLWVNDYDDGDILVHWLVASIVAVNSGAPELVGVDAIVSGGYTGEDEEGVRGLRYVLECNLVFPVVKPIAQSGSGASRTVVGFGVSQTAPPQIPPTPLPPGQTADPNISPWRRTTFVKEPVPAFPPGEDSDQEYD